jgi:hypothetical protein
MDLKEIGWWSIDWIQLAQGKDRWRAVVSAVMNLRALPPWIGWLVSFNFSVSGSVYFLRFTCVPQRFSQYDSS